MTERLRDRKWLESKYHDEEMSLRDISNEIGCHRQSVYYWMEKHGIERRKSNREKIGCIAFDENGYEMFRTGYKDEMYIVRIPRLIAVAKFGIEDVKGMHVHHKNHIPYDNRPENLDLVDPVEHGRMHGKYKPTNGGYADV